MRDSSVPTDGSSQSVIMTQIKCSNDDTFPPTADPSVSFDLVQISATAVLLPEVGWIPTTFSSLLTELDEFLSSFGDNGFSKS